MRLFPSLPHARIPRTIWALGLVSLCMDFSSELIHALLPLFLSVELGASATTIGLIEGMAEAVVSVMKVFSGFMSDWARKRKPFVVAGYGLATLTKPLFPAATSVSTVFVARFLDRVGKGIRGAPRDALIAAAAPADLRGACFGLRQSLDTVGAFLGPLAALVLMWLTHDHLRAVMWWATLPALVAVFILVLSVEEAEDHSSIPVVRHALSLSPTALGRPFWRVVIVGAVITLARFSEAFLVLRLHGLGLSLGSAPLVLIVMNIVYAASAYPVGALSDRLGRIGMLDSALALLSGACFLLAISTGPLGGLVGVALWGLHLGFSQGILSAMVAESVPAAFHGRAFGIFNLATAVSLVVGNVLAGAIWQWVGPAFSFAGASGLSLAALGLTRWWTRNMSDG